MNKRIENTVADLFILICISVTFFSYCFALLLLLFYILWKNFIKSTYTIQISLFNTRLSRRAQDIKIGKKKIPFKSHECSDAISSCIEILVCIIIIFWLATQKCFLELLPIYSILDFYP